MFCSVTESVCVGSDRRIKTSWEWVTQGGSRGLSGGLSCGL